MNYNPLVSIVINNYNYGGFLKEAIDSSLKQTYSHNEVIVVDDGSTDDSREIITSYGNKVTSVFKQNGGQASAFNAGFAVSKGDIICFLDADDMFLPEKVADIVDLFKSHQDIGWCFHSLTLLDNNTKTIINNTNQGLSCECDFRLQTRDAKLPDIPTATSGLCFTRHLLQQILPMPEDILITSDNYIKFVALALSKGFFLSKGLVFQRIHGSNAYTLRTDQEKLRTKIIILTSYWIRVNFPFLEKFTNKLFSRGLAYLYWSLGEVDPECSKIVKIYMSSISFSEKIEIHCRALYYSFKNYLLRLKQ